MIVSWKLIGINQIVKRVTFFENEVPLGVFNTFFSEFGPNIYLVFLKVPMRNSNGIWCSEACYLRCYYQSVSPTSTVLESYLWFQIFGCQMVNHDFWCFELCEWKNYYKSAFRRSTVLESYFWFQIFGCQVVNHDFQCSEMFWIVLLEELLPNLSTNVQCGWILFVISYIRLSKSK